MSSWFIHIPPCRKSRRQFTLQTWLIRILNIFVITASLKIFIGGRNKLWVRYRNCIEYFSSISLASEDSNLSEVNETWIKKCESGAWFISCDVVALKTLLYRNFGCLKSDFIPLVCVPILTALWLRSALCSDEDQHNRRREGKKETGRQEKTKFCVLVLREQPLYSLNELLTPIFCLNC